MYITERVTCTHEQPQWWAISCDNSNSRQITWTLSRSSASLPKAAALPNNSHEILCCDGIAGHSCWVDCYLNPAKPVLHPNSLLLIKNVSLKSNLPAASLAANRQQLKPLCFSSLPLLFSLLIQRQYTHGNGTLCRVGLNKVTCFGETQAVHYSSRLGLSLKLVVKHAMLIRSLKY